MLSFNKFLYSFGECSYDFVVSSASINKLGEEFIFAISAFTKCWNMLFMFLDLMDFVAPSRSFSNASSSLIVMDSFLI